MPYLSHLIPCQPTKPNLHKLRNNSSGVLQRPNWNQYSKYGIARTFNKSRFNFNAPVPNFFNYGKLIGTIRSKVHCEHYRARRCEKIGDARSHNGICFFEIGLHAHSFFSDWKIVDKIQFGDETKLDVKSIFFQFIQSAYKYYSLLFWNDQIY